MNIFISQFIFNFIINKKINIYLYIYITNKKIFTLNKLLFITFDINS